MTIRTDLLREGLYLLKQWVVKALPLLEASREPFASFDDDLMPFLAKN